MNIHDHDAVSPLKLSTAILLYEGGSYNQHTQGKRAPMYATLHNVAQEAGRSACIDAGTTLTDDALLMLLQRLRKPKAVGILPSNVLSVGDSHVTWWTPPQTRSVFFRTAKGEAQGKVRYPALIYTVVRNTLYVFATSDSERPTAETILHHAPLMNVWNDGKVCTGNVDFPTRLDLAALVQWEESLLDSYFTHPNHDGAVRACKSGMFAFYTAMMKKLPAAFPKKNLAPTKQTLAEWIAHIDKAGEQ
jgi:PRTRC genetic system protein B